MWGHNPRVENHYPRPTFPTLYNENVVSFVFFLRKGLAICSQKWPQIGNSTQAFQLLKLQVYAKIPTRFSPLPIENIIETTDKIVH